MKNLLRISFLSLLCVCIMSLTVSGQEEMKNEKQYKNVVRLNITNPLIFGDRSLVLGYERVLNDRKSFSINFGVSELPEFKLFNPGEDSTGQAVLTKNSAGRGFNTTGDFRFYLKAENKYAAPHGIYLAPYLSYASMGRKNTWSINTATFTGDVITDFNLSFLAVGGELGYQFVLWKKSDPGFYFDWSQYIRLYIES